MLETPQITRTMWVRSAVIRVTVPRIEIPQTMKAGLEELMGALAAQRVTPAGPPYAHYVMMLGDVFDFEIGVPVNAPVSPRGRVRAGDLPPTRAVRALYRGDYSGLHAAWSELEKWAGEQGHKPRGDLWESYLVGPESGSEPSEWRTELNLPIE